MRRSDSIIKKKLATTIHILVIKTLTDGYESFGISEHFVNIATYIILFLNVANFHLGVPQISNIINIIDNDQRVLSQYTFYFMSNLFFMILKFFFKK